MRRKNRSCWWLVRITYVVYGRFLPPANEVCHSCCPQGGWWWLPSVYHRSHDQGGLYPVGVCLQGGSASMKGWADPPPSDTMGLWDMVNKWVERILLECIPVWKVCAYMLAHVQKSLSHVHSSHVQKYPNEPPKWITLLVLHSLVRSSDEQ